MAMFAIRQSTPGDASTGDIEAMAVTAPDGAAFRAAYYTPDQDQVLAIYDAESPAPFESGDASREILPVLPITPEEYGPPAVEPAAGDGQGLQLVLVRRHLDPITHREFRALALQAIMCAHEYSDLLWLRSYWAREQNELLCIFRTRKHSLVREHAQRSRIPCDEVHDAIELPVSQANAGDRSNAGV